MQTQKQEYIIDGKGRKRAVILPIKDYNRMKSDLDDMADALDIRQAQKTANGYISLKSFKEEFKKEGLA